MILKAAHDNSPCARLLWQLNESYIDILRNAALILIWHVLFQDM